MSRESATRFLQAAAHDQRIREQFAAVRSQEEFFQTSKRLGYRFNTIELMQVLMEHNQGATLRRKTGVWRWMRNLPWI